jgi:hypothetical protein
MLLPGKPTPTSKIIREPTPLSIYHPLNHRIQPFHKNLPGQGIKLSANPAMNIFGIIGQLHKPSFRQIQKPRSPVFKKELCAGHQCEVPLFKVSTKQLELYHELKF